MSAERIQLIKDRLEILKPDELKIDDEGHLHVVHAGAKSGGHFKLFIVSHLFENKSMLDRHKIIYETLGDLMSTEIHALSIKALTKDEVI